MRWVWILLLGLAWTCSARAGAPVLALGPDTTSASLAGHLEQHVDPTGQQPLTEVIASGVFVPQAGFGSGGYTAAAGWYRFTLMRPPGAPADWILELAPAYLDDIQLHLPQADGRWRTVQMGDHVPYAQRPLQTRLHALRITLPDNRPATFYVRLQSTSALAFHGQLWQPDAFVAKETRDNTFHGLFFGMLLLTVVMYGVLGAWLRDAGLLTYVAYVMTLVLLYLGLNGYGAVLLGPGDGRWLDAMTGLGAIGGGIAGVLMWDRFLDLRRHFPRIHVLALLCSALMAPGLATVATPWYRLAAPLAIPLAIGLTWMFIGLLVWRIAREPRQPLLWFYLVAFVCATLGIALQFAMAAGRLPLNWLTTNGYQVGSLVHVLVLNVALAWRIRQMQKDKLLAEHEALSAAAKAADQRQLIAMLSHEFRNPLAAISRAAQLAMLKLGGQESRRLEGIREHADALYALVDKFLTWESLDYRSALLARQETSLRNLLAESVRGLEAEGRTVVDVTPEDASFSLDRQLFTLAVGNLLDNALRYSPTDTPVALEAQVGPQGLRLVVTDRGAGMSADEVARLGTPYFRTEAATRIRGVGLGFLLARKIVEAHTGSVAVRSAAGQGTSVEISLPSQPPHPA